MNHLTGVGSKRVMERCWRWLLAAALSAPLWLAHGQDAAAGNDAAAPMGTVVRSAAGGKLVINAKSVLYDFGKRLATFERNVSVTDSQVMLTASRMDVFLNADNSVQRIEAVGDVVIRELGTAKKATAGRAVYDTVQDTVVLTEDPYLEERDQGFFTKGAEKITYLRAQQQFRAEGDNMQMEFGIPEDRTRSSTDLFRTGDAPKAGGSAREGNSSETRGNRTP